MDYFVKILAQIYFFEYSARFPIILKLKKNCPPY